MALKPTKIFKLSKQTKRMMCSILNPVDRNAFKRAMIDAQLASMVVIKTEKRPTGPRPTPSAPNVE